MHYSSMIDVTNSRPETIFNQMGVVSAKVGAVKQTCRAPPPRKKILYVTLTIVKETNTTSYLNIKFPAISSNATSLESICLSS